MATDSGTQRTDLLSQSLGGGPHGVGDPEDRSLRRVEKEIMIPQKMKQKAKQLKCADEVKGFGICAKEKGFFMPFKCRKEAAHLKLCLGAAFSDPEFVDHCTQEYLDERSEYRRTGIKTHQINKKVVS